MKSSSLIQNNKIEKCNPEVSIIIPVLNVEKWVYKTIESIKNQTYQNYEVIVIDDGSIDNTYNIISNYVDDDSRFKIISRDHHGVSSARNYGLNISKGKYVTFLDGDDYWDINFLSNMINKIEKSNCDLVFSYFRIYDEVKMLFNNVVPKIESFNDKILYYYLSGDVQIPTGSYIIRKDFINKYNLKYSEDCSHYEDTEFRIKVLVLGKVLCIKEILLTVVSRIDSLSKKFDSTFLDSLIIYERSISFIKTNLSNRESKKYISEIITHTIPWRVAMVFALASLNDHDIKNNKYKIYLFRFSPHSIDDLIKYIFHMLLIFFPFKSFPIYIEKLGILIYNNYLHIWRA